MWSSLLKNCKENSCRLKYTAFFLYYLQIETINKHSNVTAATNLSYSLYVIGMTCFNECFIFYLITEKQYFLKSLSLLCGFSNHDAAAFAEISVSKEARILGYLHKNSTILTPNFKIKVYTYKIW